MKARISRKFFCLLLAVVMVCTLLPIAALAAGPSGRIERVGITHAGGYLKNAVSVGLKDVTFTESVAVKLYSGETLLTTATLKTGVLTVGQNHPFVTCCIPTEGEDDAWSLIPWTPKDDVVPDKAVLVVDGHELNTKTFTLDADEWANLPGTYSGSIERAGITHANDVLKNAVSVDLKNVNFESSVEVELYSGNTLLTTATLKPGVLTVGQNHPFVTCCIPTEGEDDAWSLIPWTPKDDVVPDKAILIVDGHELNTKTFTLDAAEWKALPGTVFPYSGSIERAGITHANDVLKNAVSVDLKNVNFESSVEVELYSGNTLLTTATLKPGVLTVGQNHPFVTCCIPTEGEDDAWSLIPWTPKDDVVPDKAILIVDGHELNTKTFTLDAAEWKALPGTVFPYSGSIERAGITHANDVLKNAVSVDLKNVNFESSVEVELYSGNTLLTTATLKPGVLTVGQNHPFVTCCIPTEGEDDAWSLIPWTPKDDVVPDKAILIVDGHELNTKTFTLDAAEWKALPGTVFPYSGSIERAGITHANDVLKNAVSVDLKNVNFESSVEVELYSGNTLLTTATLKPGVLTVGQNHPFVTCCIPTEGEDDAWSLIPWTPKDDVVPDKAILIVDGHELNTKTFTLDAAEWKALPGTVFPYSGSIERAGITHANDVLKNAVSVDLKNVNFESSVEVELYSGNTLLTTATLKPGVLTVGQNHPFVTCCIPTEGEDDAWSLIPWTPKDDVVPDKAILIVDGQELNTKTFSLDADEWAALPGTAFPSSGSIGDGYTYYTIKKATPKLNTYDHFAYVQGYPDGTVKPAGNITRAETAAILFRLMDESSRSTYYSTRSGFRDVASGTWYNTYVATLNNAGVITDSANGYFRPNEAITRAELAAMLAAFTDTTRAANYFNDVTANYWAANAIAICAKLGWINGYPDGSFRPDRNVTRAELVAMINRATGRAPKSADAFLPGMKTWSDNTADKWYYLDVQEATNSHSYAVSPTELWTALTAAPDWSRYE